MLRHLRTVALLVGALPLSCGGDAPTQPSARAGSPSADTPAKDDTPAEGDTKGDAAEPPAAPTTPAVAAVPLVKATAVLPGKTKVDGNLGFRVEDVAGLHAIEGTAVAADWGAPGSAEPSLTRDDDLLTAWTCTPTPEARCAVGLSLDAESEVTALRLFATAGPDWRDHRAHPRPKKIRVHTDSGFADAQISDGAAHEYVIFAQPVKTRTVTLEILELHKGSKDADVHVAELEVFGKTGPARPPMKLDPAAVFVSYETEAWAKKGESHTIRLAFLGTLQPDGTRRRLMRGTAVFGRADDRWILVEKLHGAGCDAVKGGRPGSARRGAFPARRSRVAGTRRPTRHRAANPEAKRARSSMRSWIASARPRSIRARGSCASSRTAAPRSWVEATRAARASPSTIRRGTAP